MKYNLYIKFLCKGKQFRYQPQFGYFGSAWMQKVIEFINVIKKVIFLVKNKKKVSIYVFTKKKTTLISQKQNVGSEKYIVISCGVPYFFVGTIISKHC